jgi:anti-sigma-K factor RskA
MSNWRRAIHLAAERDEQDHLSSDEAQAMRRTVLAAVVDDPPGRAASLWMWRPVLVAATIVAVISVGIVTGLRLDLTYQRPTIQLVPEVAPVDTTTTANVNMPDRQLQFVTPGGTRIIWVFNSDLDLKATLR